MSQWGSIRVNDAKYHQCDDPEWEADAHRMIQESIDWVARGGTLVNVNLHPRDQAIRCGRCGSVSKNATNGTYGQADPCQLQEPKMGRFGPHE
jgi:hypothetical protein